MTPFHRHAALLGLAAALALPAAAESQTPATAPGVQVITAEQARALVGRAAFFDVRTRMNYGKGHIQGAVSLPYLQRSEERPDFDPSGDRFDLGRLPADKAAPVVFYSDGPTGWKSYKAAVLAGRAGHRDVRWMREGMSGWVARGLALE